MKLTLRLIYYDLEVVMLSVLSTALLVGAVVFLAGVLFGWEYGLFLALMILVALQLISMVKR